MGTMNRLFSSVELTCPWCEEPIEVEDMAVSVTVEGHDIGRPVGDGQFTIDCDECGKKIGIESQLSIYVKKS